MKNAITILLLVGGHESLTRLLGLKFAKLNIHYCLIMLSMNGLISNRKHRLIIFFF